MTTSSAPITRSIMMRTKLCEHCMEYHIPDSGDTIAELKQEIDRLENLVAEGVHTCSNQCQRPVCVLRRENRELEQELAQTRGLCVSSTAEAGQVARLKQELAAKTKAMRSVVDSLNDMEGNWAVVSAAAYYELRAALNKEDE